MNIISKIEELKQKVNDLQNEINKFLHTIKKILGNDCIKSDKLSETSVKISLNYDDAVFTVSEAEAFPSPPQFPPLQK